MGKSRDQKKIKTLPNGPRILELRALLNIKVDTLCSEIGEQSNGNGWSASVQGKFEKCDPVKKCELFPIHASEAVLLLDYFRKKLEEASPELKSSIGEIIDEDIFVKQNSQGDRNRGNKIKLGILGGRKEQSKLDYQEAFKAALEFLASNVDVQCKREYLELLLKENIDVVTFGSNNVAFTFSEGGLDGRRSSASVEAEIARMLNSSGAIVPEKLSCAAVFHLCSIVGYPISRLISEQDENYTFFKLLEADYSES